MINRGWKWISLGLILMLAGCAGTQTVKSNVGGDPGKTPKGSLVQFSQKSTPETNVVQESVVGSKKQLWPATLAILKQEGFDIEKKDQRAGTIQTRTKNKGVMS